jgi:hypothetical protein
MSDEEYYDDVTDGELRLTSIHLLLASFVRETSVRFRSPPHQFRDYEKRLWILTNTDGVTYIATNTTAPRRKLDRFPRTVTVPDDPTSPHELRILTNELREFTSELFDIEIEKLSITWGLARGVLPSLLECDGVFRCKEESEPYAQFLTDIGLVIALETARVQEPGKCFSRKQACTGPDMACPRQKIVTWKSKQLGKGLGIEDSGEFLRYMRKRIGLICPPLMLSSVFVCRGCFAVYSKERTPAPGGEAAASGRSAPTPLSGRAIAPQVIEPNIQIVEPKRPQSNVPDVPGIIRKSWRQARKTYISRPFPAFLQRRV